MPSPYFEGNSSGVMSATEARSREWDMPNAAISKDSSPVEMTLRSLMNAVDALEKMTEQTEVRLSSALVPNAPTTGNDSKAAAERSKSPLAEQLSHIEYRINRVTGALSSLLHRCEL